MKKIAIVLRLQNKNKKNNYSEIFKILVGVKKNLRTIHNKL